MFYRAVAPITCCLLVSLSVFAAPRKDTPPPSYYHPSTVGDKAVYELWYVEEPDEKWEVVREVTDVQKKGNSLIVTTQSSDAQLPCRYEVSNKGVYKVGEGNIELKSPECYLRLPYKKGATWETTHAFEGSTSAIKYTIVGEEEVQVPAGKFHCIRIETECTFEKLYFTRVHWENRQHGSVKEVLEVTGQDGTKYKRTKVLKSFTPGRP